MITRSAGSLLLALVVVAPGVLTGCDSKPPNVAKMAVTVPAGNPR